MKRKIVAWTAEKLYERRDRIQYPPYQREPTVWTQNKKQKLIDSMLIGLDIPKIYLYSPPNSKYCKDENDETTRIYDCVDGQQRIVSVIQFFNGQLKLEDGRLFRDLTKEEKDDILSYEFTIALITKATDEDLRLLFLRLQLGAPLNVGEKLHAMKGPLRDFIFTVGRKHPFFASLPLQERRFYRETIFAEICINSFYRSLKGTFFTARYEELKAFVEQYSDITKYQKEIKRIQETLDLMSEYFKDCAPELRNRAVVVTAYLYFEKLYVDKAGDKLKVFPKFYKEFVNILSEQTSKGLDYDRKYRELLNFQNYVIQAATSKTAITARDEIIGQFFEYYLNTEKIKGSN
jgi:hypothetical protein